MLSFIDSVLSPFSSVLKKSSGQRGYQQTLFKTEQFSGCNNRFLFVSSVI